MLHIEKEMFIKNDAILEIADWQTAYDIKAGFTTKNGGVSSGAFQTNNQSYTVGDDAAAVLQNRKMLAEAVGIPLEQWVFAQQQHTKNIQRVSVADCGAGVTDFESGIAATDGLYTSDKGVVLAAFFADCTPVYFAAPTKGLIGIVHAGWQGTVQEISRAFVKEWFALGVKAKDIQVVIGPHASQSAYRVGIDVVQQVIDMELLDARDALIDLGEGQFKLDTGYLNYLQLIDLDIPEENIVMSSYCTISDSDLFFSYRRENKTGRMLGYITQ